MRRTERGFTLVELLVVIGIIAVLIAILLPALNKARKAGQGVKCLSNLKQLGTAASMYQNDNKGVFPVHIDWTGGTNGQFLYWDRLLAPYIGIRTIDMSVSSATPQPHQSNLLICPSDRTIDPPPGFFKRSYTANGLRNVPNTRPEDGVVLGRQAWLNGVKAPRVTSVNRPAHTVFLYENTTPAADGITPSLHNLQWCSAFGSNAGWIGTPPINATGSSPRYPNGDFAHHGKVMSVLYVDGHAAPENPMEFHTLTPPGIHGISVWSRAEK